MSKNIGQSNTLRIVKLQVLHELWNIKKEGV